jgi:hypothetical protein
MWICVTIANIAVAQASEGLFQEVGFLCAGFAMAQVMTEWRR